MPLVRLSQKNHRQDPSGSTTRRRKGNRETPVTDADHKLQDMNKAEANRRNYERISALLEESFKRPRHPPIANHGHPVRRYILNGRNGNLDNLGVWFDTVKLFLFRFCKILNATSLVQLWASRESSERCS